MTVLNVTGEIENLIRLITSVVPELNHIDPSRVLVCVASTRGGGVHGTYAKIHPLRFTGGERSMVVRRGRKNITWSMPGVTYRGVDMLYIIYFLVPRFLNLSLREKLITIFHELYHISPDFNGDIRRFPGKNYAHGSSRKRYNAFMAKLVDGFLGGMEDDSPVKFLHGDMETMRACHGTIVGRRFPAPRVQVSNNQ
jgi:predicted metallopeptidase